MQKVSSEKKKIMHTNIVWIIIKIEVTLGKSLSLQQIFLSVKRDMMKPESLHYKYCKPTFIRDNFISQFTREKLVCGLIFAMKM